MTPEGQATNAIRDILDATVRFSCLESTHPRTINNFPAYMAHLEQALKPAGASMHVRGMLSSARNRHPVADWANDLNSRIEHVDAAEADPGDILYGLIQRVTYTVEVRELGIDHKEAERELHLYVCGFQSKWKGIQDGTT